MMVHILPIQGRIKSWQRGKRLSLPLKQGINICTRVCFELSILSVTGKTLELVWQRDIYLISFYCMALKKSLRELAVF